MMLTAIPLDCGLGAIGWVWAKGDRLGLGEAFATYTSGITFYLMVRMLLPYTVWVWGRSMMLTAIILDCGLGAIAIAALLFNLGNSSEAFLLLKAQQVLIPNAQIPLVLVVMNLSYALSAYPMGILSDRVNRKTLLLAGWGFNAMIYLGLAIAQSPWLVWLLVGCYGLYLGMTQGVLLAIVADRVPEHLRGTAFGFLNLLVGIALLPASLLAGWLWQTISPAAAFIAGSGFAVAAVVLLVQISTAESI